MITLSFDPIAVGKFLLVVAAGAVAYLIVRAFIRGIRHLFAPKLQGLDRKGILARWAEVESMAKDGSELQLKMAVLEADKLLDHALKAMAIPGTTLGERLKFAAYKHPKIKRVWNAHRLRNQLVHESSFYLSPPLARSAVKDYKEALKMLNLL